MVTPHFPPRSGEGKNLVLPIQAYCLLTVCSPKPSQQDIASKTYLCHWLSSQWSTFKSNAEVPSLFINKQTSQLRKHCLSVSFEVFGGQTIMCFCLFVCFCFIYIWVGQIDTDYMLAVFVVFFSSKTWNLLICLHSLGYHKQSDYAHSIISDP